MRFAVTRTSVGAYDVQACDGLEIEYFGKELPIPNNRWIIELNTAEDVVDFIKSVGGLVVIDTHKFDDGIPVIEIYDDYREGN